MLLPVQAVHSLNLYLLGRNKQGKFLCGGSLHTCLWTDKRKAVFVILKIEVWQPSLKSKSQQSLSADAPVTWYKLAETG